MHQPPRVATKFASETVVKGSTATLQCRAEGDPVLRAEWNRDMQPIDSAQNQRYVVKEDTARGSITSYLEIIDTRRLDSALFTCIVTSPFGSDSTNIQLIVQGNNFVRSVVDGLFAFALPMNERMERKWKCKSKRSKMATA